jgi:hypothetical protein
MRPPSGNVPAVHWAGACDVISPVPRRLGSCRDCLGCGILGAYLSIPGRRSKDDARLDALMLETIFRKVDQAFPDAVLLKTWLPMPVVRVATSIGTRALGIC